VDWLYYVREVCTMARTHLATTFANYLLALVFLPLIVPGVLRASGAEMQPLPAVVLLAQALAVLPPGPLVHAIVQSAVSPHEAARPQLPLLLSRPRMAVVEEAGSAPSPAGAVDSGSAGPVVEPEPAAAAAAVVEPAADAVDATPAGPLGLLQAVLAGLQGPAETLRLATLALVGTMLGSPGTPLCLMVALHLTAAVPASSGVPLDMLAAAGFAMPDAPDTPPALRRIAPGLRAAVVDVVARRPASSAVCVRAALSVLSRWRSDVPLEQAVRIGVRVRVSAAARPSPSDT
jgi:hypothetical protein